MAQATDEEVAEYLDMAAEIVERQGWCQGSFGSPARGWCAVGAINATTLQVWQNAYLDNRLSLLNRFNVDNRAVAALAAYLTAENPDLQKRLTWPGPWPTVETWNDERGRTVEDVTNAMRKAAITLREQVGHE